jgi:D-alanine-D-alanine ligase
MKIAVFFGSRNPEHDVSIITGQLIISGLKEMGYDVLPVYIGKTGTWFVGKELGDLEFFKEKNYESKLSRFGGFSLDLRATGKLVLQSSGLMSSRKYEADLAFPAIHGQNGEDGTLQGLFEIMNIPYVGCDVTASTIAIDKVLTKLMYQRFDIPTTDFIYFNKSDWASQKESLMGEAIQKMSFPMFVKPARLGSSIGITKVKTQKDLEFAIEVALHYDEKILIEQGIENLKDLTVCIIGNDKLIASKIQESAYSQDFFSYEDKYINDGGAQTGNATKKLIIPANIDDKTAQDITKTALDVYKKIGCTGIARVDFLYDQTSSKFYANEVNTLPGTIYHHLWKESGIVLKDLLEKLISYAQERYSMKQKQNYTFESEILTKANGSKLGSKLGT